MNTLVEQQIFFQTSGRRFADHYCAYVQKHEGDFAMLDEEFDNIRYALDAYGYLEEWLSIVRLIRTLDFFLDTRGYWAELRFWLEKTIDHDEALGDLPTRLQFLCSLADVIAAQGDLDQAEILYNQVIDLAEQTNQHAHLRTAYFGLSSVYRNQGKLDEAQRCLEEFRIIAQRAGDEIQDKIASYFLEADSLSKHGEKRLPLILSFVGQIARGLRHFGKAHTLSMRAWAHLTLEQYDQARKYYLQALKHAKQEGDAQGTAFVLYQLGLIATMEDDLIEALTYFHESRSITEQLNNETGLLLLYGSIGLLHIRQERFDLARPYFEQSVILARKSRHQQEIADNLYWLGYAVANTGEPERAKGIFEESLAIFAKLGSSETHKVSGALSRLRQAMGKRDG